MTHAWRTSFRCSALVGRPLFFFTIEVETETRRGATHRLAAMKESMSFLIKNTRRPNLTKIGSDCGRRVMSLLSVDADLLSNGAASSIGNSVEGSSE